jgi:hypothetical protein
MRTRKKPEAIDINKIIKETAEAYIITLTSLTNKIVEIVGYTEACESEIRLLKIRIAALEKGESDRQSHEVTK